MVLQTQHQYFGFHNLQKLAQKFLQNYLLDLWSLYKLILLEHLHLFSSLEAHEILQLDQHQIKLQCLPDQSSQCHRQEIQQKNLVFPDNRIFLLYLVSENILLLNLKLHNLNLVQDMKVAESVL